ARLLPALQEVVRGEVVPDAERLLGHLGGPLGELRRVRLRPQFLLGLLGHLADLPPEELFRLAAFRHDLIPFDCWSCLSYGAGCRVQVEWVCRSMAHACRADYYRPHCKHGQYGHNPRRWCRPDHHCPRLVATRAPSSSLPTAIYQAPVPVDGR